ncbi:CesT family type III secretion system chaperone [Pseudomonas sp. FP2196]|uniref:CesT family type III secretion system chaperone n=1 Tax=Pseudomonas sp. FP2196 TaxID=2954086 RepID=UPI00273534CA|nr:CesT family type III secretion system chaperone [Pseudomonas sp. FP2196]WLH36485.1 CesT family type III secretion system chaperone [Pseudomonas sp. FP2196]
MNPTQRQPLDTPLPEAAAAWLFNAAKHLGIAEQPARDFASSGELQLPGLTLQLTRWQSEPVTQWIVLAQLPRPDNLTPLLWNELLLRANCSISAMSACVGALDERGHGLLVSRLAYRPYSDHPGLASELDQLIAVAESLVAGATALSSATGHSEPSSVAPPPSSPDTAPAAKAAMEQRWHRPLLIQALQRLGIEPPPAAHLQTVGVIRIGARSFEVIADGDQRNVLVSTPIDTPLRSAVQREQALRANLQLMLLTGCAVALAPQGSCLQSRWDSTGLDGEAFADWLLDVAQLADSFVAPSPAALPKRNPAWT